MKYPDRRQIQTIFAPPSKKRSHRTAPFCSPCRQKGVNGVKKDTAIGRVLLHENDICSGQMHFFSSLCYRAYSANMKQVKMIRNPKLKAENILT